MSEGDHIDGPYLSQDQLSFLHKLFIEILNRFFPPPPIEPQQFYTRQEAIRRLRIGNDAWTKLVKGGLTVVHGKPYGTSNDYVLGQSIIDCLSGKKTDGKGTKGKG